MQQLSALGKKERERCATSLSLAETEVAAEQSGDTTRNRESHSCSGGQSARLRNAKEFLEHLFAMGRWDTRAVVGNVYRCHPIERRIVAMRDANTRFAAPWRVLHGIRKKVAEHLSHARRVGKQ
jgi:tRNA splicing ligase